MHLIKHIAAVIGLGFAILLSTAHGQSGSSVETGSEPAHSGNAAGANGPKSTPPPPARRSTNAVSNGEDNLPLQTFTGIVSDSLCGRHHYLLSHASDAECTRYCIAHQATYVLVVGDKLYALVDPPGHALDALAGKEARVTGALVESNVLEVNSVGPATSGSK